MKSILEEQLVSEQAGQRLTSAPSTIKLRRLRVSFWEALLARYGFVAYLPMGVALCLLFCGVLRLHTDALHYQCYTVAFWQGTRSISLLPHAQCSFFAQFNIPQNSAGPFSILPLEYPPLTLLLFSIVH